MDEFTGRMLAAVNGMLLDMPAAIARKDYANGAAGAWWDNVFVERLWRSIEYEEIHPRAYDSVGGPRSAAP